MNYLATQTGLDILNDMKQYSLDDPPHFRLQAPGAPFCHSVFVRSYWN